MPTYKFLNTKTKKQFLEFMKISELDPYLAANPHLQQRVNGAPLIAYGTMGSEIKSDNGFKEVLSKIAEKHPQSPLADRYLRKSAKEVQTERVVAKHKKRSNSK